MRKCIEYVTFLVSLIIFDHFKISHLTMRKYNIKSFVCRVFIITNPYGFIRSSGNFAH